MPPISARLDLRLESRENDRIVKAAALRGMAVSALVLSRSRGGFLRRWMINSTLMSA